MIFLVTDSIIGERVIRNIRLAKGLSDEIDNFDRRFPLIWFSTLFCKSGKSMNFIICDGFLRFREFENKYIVKKGDKKKEIITVENKGKIIFLGNLIFLKSQNYIDTII